MQHALIIDDNMLMGKLIEGRLAGLGFGSFDHAWTEEGALRAAEKHFPDLVVIGDDVEAGSIFEAARKIAARREVPILFVTADRVRAERQLPHGAARLSLQDLDRAVSSARQDQLVCAG